MNIIIVGWFSDPEVLASLGFSKCIRSFGLLNMIISSGFRHAGFTRHTSPVLYKECLNDISVIHYLAQNACLFLFDSACKKSIMFFSAVYKTR